jgi:hypothetical protein
MAGALPLLEVLVVVTFCETVRSPVRVDTAIVPMEDELFIAQRELRRAQALVESLTHGGGACSAL